MDGIPLPLGEDFTGVIRVQDIRVTEKDKVKVGDCFRGGDVIKGSVVRTRSVCLAARLLNCDRSPLEMHAVTT